jgi:hypothetical protein
MTTECHVYFERHVWLGLYINSHPLSLKGTVLCEITLFLLGGTMEPLWDVYCWRTLERGKDMISTSSQGAAEE